MVLRVAQKGEEFWRAARGAQTAFIAWRRPEMRIRPLVTPLFLLPTLVLAARDTSAMGGLEGTFDYALDAPWRIEPVMDAAGRPTYGAIPISVTILDENVIPFDNLTPSKDPKGGLVPVNNMLGNFCHLDVAHGSVTRNIPFQSLNEVEMTGNASTNVLNGAWQLGKGPPPHAICRPSTQSCGAFQNLHGTSEWHATAWYTPDGFTPGADVMLTLTASITRSPAIPCTSTKATDFLTLKNYVSVHAGEAPLPRFHDARWAYGDLHFHGQGTDNEGESGYSYRNVIRAMGSLGLDFVLATEHASDSDQILDADYDGIGLQKPISRHGTALRDMSAERFAFLREQLWGEGGINKTTALDGHSNAGVAALPQNVIGHGVAPQIFLGGEVDVIPELPANFPHTGSFLFGNGISYSLGNLCGGWNGQGFTHCGTQDVVQQDLGVTILKDVQGWDAIHPARAHMVYMPSDPKNANGFVASKTGVFGGGGRHMVKSGIYQGVLPEMENEGGPQKGYAFLAHPVPAGACSGGTPDLSGNEGPDVVPYTPLMLDEAFHSKAVLGLELWNEDIRMLNEANSGRTREMGFESPSWAHGQGFRTDQPKGFVTGQFEMYPWATFPEPSYAKACTSMEWTLHHGLKEWDDLMLRGIMPSATAGIAWLPAGEPRRMFMAGGSDAHGDLNYHRSGYFRALTQTDDMAIGKPRNLVMAGAPDVLVLDGAKASIILGGGAVAIGASKAPGGKVHGGHGGLGGLGGAGGGVIADVRAHSHAQVLSALTSGTFSVTDGPAVRIAIDKNGNGVIDDADAQMGSVIEMYGDKTIPLVIEWESTPEWGDVQQIEIVIGALKTVGATYHAVFAPVANGPRSSGTPSVAVSRTRPVGGGKTVNERADGYVEDPTGGLLRFTPLSMSGRRVVHIPISALSLADDKSPLGILPDRLFVRAFARSQRNDGHGHCTPDAKSGACLFRYAFANPVWAISPATPAGTCPTNKPRAIDSDGDGLPDGCDPCPSRKGICLPTPGGGAGGGVNRL